MRDGPFGLLPAGKIADLVPGGGLLFSEGEGVPARNIVVSRALGSLLAGLFLSLAATVASGLLICLSEDRLPLLGRLIGPVEELLTPPLLVPVSLFVIVAALLSGAASSMGWRAAQPRPK